MNDYTTMHIENFEKSFGPAVRADRVPDVPHPGEERNETGHPYRSPIASCLWLCRCLGSDLLRAVCSFASAVEFWTPNHTKAFSKFIGLIKFGKPMHMILRYQPAKDDEPSKLRVRVHLDASLAEP